MLQLYLRRRHLIVVNVHGEDESRDKIYEVSVYIVMMTMAYYYMIYDAI